MKRIIALLLVTVTMLSLLTIGVSAASKTPWKCSQMVEKNGGYYHQYNWSKIDGQNMCEKAITVKKGTTATVTADVDIWGKCSSRELTKYVRFALWIYDVKTNKRVVNTIVQPGQTYRLPIDNNASHTYSVQIRPYMHTSVWRTYAKNMSTVNTFLQLNGFHLTWK